MTTIHFPLYYPSTSKINAFIKVKAVHIIIRYNLTWQHLMSILMLLNSNLPTLPVLIMYMYQSLLIWSTRTSPFMCIVPVNRPCWEWFHHDVCLSLSALFCCVSTLIFMCTSTSLFISVFMSLLITFDVWWNRNLQKRKTRILVRQSKDGPWSHRRSRYRWSGRRQRRNWRQRLTRFGLWPVKAVYRHIFLSRAVRHPVKNYPDRAALAPQDQVVQEPAPEK